MSSRTTVLSKKGNSCRLAGPWSNRGVWNRYIPTCTRWLVNCLVYTLRTHLRLGKKLIPVRWYQTSKHWVSAFCSFSFHLGTVGVFVIILYHLGLKIVFKWWVCLGAGRALIYLTVFLFKSSWYGKNTNCCIVMLTRCRRYPPCAVCIRFRETFDWPND